MRLTCASMLLSAILCAACGGDRTTSGSDSGAADCEDPVLWYADADADGFGVDEVTQEGCDQPGGFVGVGGDCDDTDDAIHPGVEEVCDDADQDCDGLVDEGDAAPAAYYLDDDLDGFGDPDTEVVRCERPASHVVNDRDCDDDDASVFPGATEVCDGVDQDCDGDADNDAVDDQAFYVDADGDGVGVELGSLEACEQPEGYADVIGDCDDSAEDVYPGADEVCGGGDEDCDGDVDERTAVDVVTWYRDGDNDGYGDLFLTETTCNEPPGFVQNGDDCDDADPSISPAATELCNGRDDNCDGSTDGSDAADTTTWYSDADSDGYGTSATTTTACDEPSGYTDNPDDCDDSQSAVNPGETEVCADGVDNDCSGDASGCVRSGTWETSDADVVLLGTQAYDYSGVAVDAAGDVDGDGVEDLVVGSWYESSGGTDAGAAYVVLGPVTSGDLARADGFWMGQESYENAGRIVAGAGDVDGDGLDDLLVGSPNASIGGSYTGAAYLLAGPATGSASLSAASAVLTGWNSSDYLGQSVDGAGDLNADGHGDLVLGAPYESTGASYGGAAYVIHGPVTSSTAAVYLAAGIMYGDGSSNYLGQEVAGVGDVDGDGLDDLVFGAPNATDSAGSAVGAAFLFLGPATGTTTSSGADAEYLGGASGDYAGNSIAGVGDTNGDGYDDVLVGAPYEDSAGSSAGAAYLLTGPLSGNHSLASSAVVITGDDSNDNLGHHVDGADLDGDGLADLVVSAPYDSSYSGAVGLFLSPLSGSMTLAAADLRVEGQQSYDYVGYGLGTPADVDGDGQRELLLGAMGDDTNGSYAGAAYGFSYLDP